MPKPTIPAIAAAAVCLKDILMKYFFLQATAAQITNAVPKRQATIHSPVMPSLSNSFTMTGMTPYSRDAARIARMPFVTSTSALVLLFRYILKIALLIV